MSNTTVTRIKPAGTRPYVRALSASQGHHMTGIRATGDGAEQLTLGEQHDQVSDAYHKQADDQEDLALEARDPRQKDAHIRASRGYRHEAYRFEAYEDSRRAQAMKLLIEAHEAGRAGVETCEAMLVGWSQRGAVSVRGNGSGKAA